MPSNKPFKGNSDKEKWMEQKENSQKFQRFGKKSRDHSFMKHPRQSGRGRGK